MNVKFSFCPLSFSQCIIFRQQVNNYKARFFRVYRSRQDAWAAQIIWGVIMSLPPSTMGALSLASLYLIPVDTSKFVAIWYNHRPSREKNIILYRPCARGKICYSSESYVRCDRGRPLRDWPAHPPSPLTFYVRFLLITRIFHGRGEGRRGLYWVY